IGGTATFSPLGGVYLIGGMSGGTLRGAGSSLRASYCSGAFEVSGAWSTVSITRLELGALTVSGIGISADVSGPSMTGLTVSATADSCRITVGSGNASMAATITGGAFNNIVNV